MVATRVEVQELREHRATLEGRLTDVERQVAESRAEMRNLVYSLRDPQSFNPHK